MRPVSVFFCLMLLVGLGARSAGGATARGCRALDAEALLVRARQTFRRRAQPPYVVYTVSRRETVNGGPDFENTYRLRIWYRSSDGAALTRRMSGSSADGALVFAKPRFNAPVDPGPPTADIFEPAPPRTPRAATPPVRSDLLEIGRVSVHVELDYSAAITGCDEATVQLALHPRRDPDRNRLRELWVDAATFQVRRFVATDRLYRGLTDIWFPDVADATLQTRDGMPLVTTIHMNADTDAGSDTSDYRFYDVEFPDTLPAWYFEPQTYGAHVAGAPAT